jgi:hypothetical protein
MAHDGSGQGWDIDAPANTDPSHPNGAVEIRDLRRGVAIRMDKEHEALADGEGGGEHLNGSAKAYYQNTFPTLRPDASTAFNNADVGRLLVRSDTFVAYVRTSTGWQAVRIADGSLTQAKLASGVIAPSLSAVISDTRAVGTDGGTFNSGAWRTRELNTEDNDPHGLVSISSSAFTLGTGTFRVWASAPAYGCGSHQIRLRKTSGTPATIKYGNSARSEDDPTISQLVATQVEGGQTYEIQHRCETSQATNGFGIANSFDGVEVYCQVHIEKIAP